MRHYYPVLAAIVVALLFYWLLNAIGQGHHAHYAIEGILIALILWYAIDHKKN